MINSKILKPGRTTDPLLSAHRVSVIDFKNPCPSTGKKALSPSNPDAKIWLDSFVEEYDNLKRMHVYEEITKDQFRIIQHKCGRPLPTMCVLTIKYKNGYPDRVKSRIVVLGNQQSTQFAPSDTYAPVILQNQIRCLLFIAIQHKCKLKQDDVKNAFCNGVLPPEKVAVVIPPKGCPLSKPDFL